MRPEVKSIPSAYLAPVSCVRCAPSCLLARQPQAQHCMQKPFKPDTSFTNQVFSPAHRPRSTYSRSMAQQTPSPAHASPILPQEIAEADMCYPDGTIHEIFLDAKREELRACDGQWTFSSLLSIWRPYALWWVQHPSIDAHKIMREMYYMHRDMHEDFPPWGSPASRRGCALLTG